MYKKERILVTMTSWHKRIDNVVPVLTTILNQTMLPDKIYLNLCIQDFPYMEEDLPKELIDFVDAQDGFIEIYWYLENYKAIKKHLHTIEIANDDDLIMSIDDDHLYPEDFIEKMYSSYLFYDKRYGVTTNKIMFVNNLWNFNGPGTLYKKTFLPKNYKMFLEHQILTECFDDLFLTLLMASNGYLFMPCIYHLPPDDEMLYNDHDSWTDSRNKVSEEERERIRNLTINGIKNLIDIFERKMYYNKKSPYNPSLWEFLQKIFVEIEGYSNPLPQERILVDNAKTNYLAGQVYNVDFASVGCDLPLYRKEDLVGDRKVYLSISSWPNRIQNVKTVVQSALDNRILPDKIYINLSEEDFLTPTGKAALTEEQRIAYEDLVMFCHEHSDMVTISWHHESALKSWKKYLNVINYADIDDVIIVTDDDVILKQTFIETMLKTFNAYGRNFPVSCNIANTVLCSFGYNGVGTLFTKRFLGEYDKYLTNGITYLTPEDNVIHAFMTVAGYIVLPVIGYDYLFETRYFNEGDAAYGNNAFTAKWWEDYTRITELAYSNMLPYVKDREEMSLNWSPWIFNFAVSNLKKYVETYENIHTGPISIVYDTLKNKFFDRPGDISDVSPEVLNKLKNTIL